MKVNVEALKLSPEATEELASTLIRTRQLIPNLAEYVGFHLGVAIAASEDAGLSRTELFHLITTVCQAVDGMKDKN